MAFLTLIQSGDRPATNAAFKKETSDLVAHSCTIADEVGSNAMERL
jgi:hypothetical protein